MSKLPTTPDIVGESLCIFCSYRCNKGLIAGKPKITFSCPYCCSVFSDKTVLNQHVMTHTKERSHKCTRCKYRTDAERSLLEHMKGKHLMCASCNPFQTFDTKAQLDRHWKDCHSVVNKNFNNRTAKTVTKSDENLENKTDNTQKPPGIIVETNQSHEQKVVNQDNNFTFVNTAQEQLTKSENDDKNLCTFCNYNCNRGTVKDDPEMNSQKVKFDCSYCCSRFLQKKDLKDHLMIHTKERPYKCEDCDFRTDYPFNLERHHLRKKHMTGYLTHKAFLKNLERLSFYFHQLPKKRKRTSSKSPPHSKNIPSTT